MIIESSSNRRFCFSLLFLLFFSLLRSLLYSAFTCSLNDSSTDLWRLACAWIHLPNMGSLGLLSTSSCSSLSSSSPRPALSRGWVVGSRAAK